MRQNHRFFVKLLLVFSIFLAGMQSTSYSMMRRKARAAKAARLGAIPTHLDRLKPVLSRLITLDTNKYTKYVTSGDFRRDVGVVDTVVQARNFGTRLTLLPIILAHLHGIAQVVIVENGFGTHEDLQAAINLFNHANGAAGLASLADTAGVARTYDTWKDLFQAVDTRDQGLITEDDNLNAQAEAIAKIDNELINRNNGDFADARTAFSGAADALSTLLNTMHDTTNAINKVNTVASPSINNRTKAAMKAALEAVPTTNAIPAAHDNMSTSERFMLEACWHSIFNAGDTGDNNDVINNTHTLWQSANTIYTAAKYNHLELAADKPARMDETIASAAKYKNLQEKLHALANGARAVAMIAGDVANAKTAWDFITDGANALANSANDDDAEGNLLTLAKIRDDFLDNLFLGLVDLMAFDTANPDNFAAVKDIAKLLHEVTTRYKDDVNYEITDGLMAAIGAGTNSARKNNVLKKIAMGIAEAATFPRFDEKGAEELKNIIKDWFSKDFLTEDNNFIKYGSTPLLDTIATQVATRSTDADDLDKTKKLTDSVLDLVSGDLVWARREDLNDPSAVTTHYDDAYNAALAKNAQILTTQIDTKLSIATVFARGLVDKKSDGVFFGDNSLDFFNNEDRRDAYTALIDAIIAKLGNTADDLTAINEMAAAYKATWGNRDIINIGTRNYDDNFIKIINKELAIATQLLATPGVDLPSIATAKDFAIELVANANKDTYLGERNLNFFDDVERQAAYTALINELLAKYGLEDADLASLRELFNAYHRTWDNSDELNKETYFANFNKIIKKTLEILTNLVTNAADKDQQVVQTAIYFAARLVNNSEAGQRFYQTKNLGFFNDANNRTAYFNLLGCKAAGTDPEALALKIPDRATDNTKADAIVVFLKNFNTVERAAGERVWSLFDQETQRAPIIVWHNALRSDDTDLTNTP